MRTAVYIFRKDVRHLWPIIAIAVTVQAATVYLEDLRAQGVASMNPLAGLIQVLLPLSMMCLLVIAIQDDSLCDERQFWLTRPYGWKSLLVAKVLFVLAFVCLPFLASDATRLAMRGLPFKAHICDMLLSQAALSQIVLTVAALATVTRGLAQFTFTGLAVVLAAATLPMLSGRGDAGASWGRLDWFRTDCQIAVLALATLAVVLLQYSRRMPVMARSILGGGYVVTLLMAALLPWDVTFAVQSRVTGSRPEAQTVRLAFDPGRGPLNKIADRPNQRKVYVTIPITMTGVPAGMDSTFDAARVKLANAGSAAWDSGWRSDLRLSTQEGDQWAEIGLDRDVFERLKSRPVELHASVAITVFADYARAVVPARPGKVNLESGGCTVDGTSTDLPSLNCQFHQGKSRMLVQVEDPASGASTPRVLASDSRAYGPRPGPVVITPYRLAASQYSGWFRGAHRGVRFIITTQRPAAHVIRDLTAQGVKLEDYRVKEL